MIDRFAGRYRFLSNFWRCHVRYDGIDWLSAEHAYQYAKSPCDATFRMIGSATVPAFAKEIGRNLTLRKDWEQVRLDVMKTIVTAKFRDNPILGERLVGTGDEELIEGNTWHDIYWGVCNGIGENHLGKILMCVRSELK